MHLKQLEINHLRNLEYVKVYPNEQCNIIFGSNASGKTSILEAIYLLSVARSFRTTQIRKVISHESSSLQVMGKIESPKNHEKATLGIERSLKKTRIRINNQDVTLVSELSTHLPVQIINPDVHKLLEQGPKYRRQYIDWGVFHVEHDFNQYWQQYYRILRQRNAALKQKSPRKQIQLWNEQLIHCAKNITLFREEYLKSLDPVFRRYIYELLGLDTTLSYFRGWNHDKTFTESLETSFDKDFMRGYTTIGPHRADLILLNQERLVQDVFSRGQQKLLVCALRLAQISHLRKTKNIQSVILVDDLAAELDREHREKLLSLLLETEAQLFLTATEKDSLTFPDKIQKKMFHVEHGTVKEVIQ